MQRRASPSGRAKEAWRPLDAGPGEHRDAADIGGDRRPQRLEQLRRDAERARSGPRPSSLGTSSTAPSSSARIALGDPVPACALTTTTGRGDSDMMYPMASSPPSSGICRSIVTTSGWSACTCSSAWRPFAAVPTTRNSPEPATSSLTRRRKNALSSTTSTLGRSEELFTLPDHPHGDPSLPDPEPDRAALGPANRLGHDGNGHVAAAPPARR